MLYLPADAKKLPLSGEVDLRSKDGEGSLPMITPSVIACGDATFPKGTAFSGGGKVSGSTQRLPLGGAGALAPEGMTPPVKKGF